MRSEKPNLPPRITAVYTYKNEADKTGNRAKKRKTGQLFGLKETNAAPNDMFCRRFISSHYIYINAFPIAYLRKVQQIHFTRPTQGPRILSTRRGGSTQSSPMAQLSFIPKHNHNHVINPVNPRIDQEQQTSRHYFYTNITTQKYIKLVFRFKLPILLIVNQFQTDIYHFSTRAVLKHFCLGFISRKLQSTTSNQSLQNKNRNNKRSMRWVVALPREKERNKSVDGVLYEYNS